MKLFVRDRGFYKVLLATAIPIATQNLITVAVSMMDTIMIGQLGQQQLAATSIANQMWFFIMIVGFGLGGGSNVLLAQYWGKHDVAFMRRVMAVTYKIALVVSIFFSVLALLVPSQFMAIFTTDEAVIRYGVEYLRIMAISYPLFLIGNLTIQMLRSVGTVKIAVVVYMTSLVVNTTLNYMLIFGNWGAPRLGVAGGAIATVVARVFELVIAAFYLLKKENKICFSLRDLLPNNRDMYRKYWGVCAPVMGNELMWGIGASLLAVVIGRIGTDFVAANSIYQVLNQLVTVFIYGMSHATLTIVGNTIGAGRYEDAKQRAATLYVLAVLLGLCSAGIMLVASPLFVSLYNVEAQTAAITLQITRVGAIIVFFQALALVGMMGILRAGGDAKFVLVCEIVFLWGIAVPFGFYTGLVLHWPIPIVFFILKIDDILKTIVATIRILSFRWIRDVTLPQPERGVE